MYEQKYFAESYHQSAFANWLPCYAINEVQNIIDIFHHFDLLLELNSGHFKKLKCTTLKK
jgi:hypothetical protein